MHVAPDSFKHYASRGRKAFNLVEALVAMAVCGIMFLALYGGISSSFFNVRMARENLRATQILVEKMEVIRLCTWDQINSNGFILTNFTAPLYLSAKPTTNAAAFFHGNITVKPVQALGPNPTPGAIPGSELGAAYRNDLRIVTVSVGWRTGGVPRTRRLSTYVSRYGIQNYVFN
jgi:type II secretory pathway pseudopilin PulG